jgi:BCD family chlorophyll transporter-like MFS transporter
MAFLRWLLKTLRLGLIRVGAGWMFALLTFNWNRITIVEFGVIAVFVTTLIGLHHFISFFHVYWGHFADQHPIFGMRRTPYILISSFCASLVFLLLPTLSIELGNGNPLAYVGALPLIIFFGFFMSMNGSSANAILAEVTTDKERGGIVAIVWAVIIISGIASAGVARAIMPVYDPAQMQFLYNLTPIVVMTTAILGVIGLEKRIGKEELAKQVAESKAQEVASPLGTFRIFSRLMGSNPHVRGFFFFVLLAVMGIFLQDAILEPFGGEVFGLEAGETAAFQQAWGVGALLGMMIIGAISSFIPISKKLIATIGGFATAAGLAIIAASGPFNQVEWIMPALVLMGIGIGLFDVGALSMMMEMTIEGQAGLFMGLWGMAQGLGNGFANVFSGALHSLFIETGLLSVVNAYTVIFTLEALVMITAVGILRSISVQEFKALSRGEIGTVLAMDTAS